MDDLMVARVLLFFSIHHGRKEFQCALVNWFLREEERDPDTGMWIVFPERDEDTSELLLEVITIDSIVRGAHLLPVFTESRVPPRFHYLDSLDQYDRFFINHYIDHHAHELVLG